MKRKKLSLYVCGCVKVYAIYFLAFMSEDYNF
jgi:hypothetical protein